MSTLTCPSREDLKAFALGTLSADQIAAIGQHLDCCTACVAELSTIELAGDTLVASLGNIGESDTYERESSLQRALQRIEEFGRDPSFTAAAVGQQEASNPDDTLAPQPAAVRHGAPEAADLGTLHDYRLLAKLGQGGMGAVYKALHIHLEKIVALKVLPKERITDPGAVARFEREIKAVGRLNHPHIVQALDARQIEGSYILALEYVEGMDLNDVATHVGSLRIADACEVVRQAALGLQAAFEHGLIHRDIKPSNLMLSVVSGPLSMVASHAQRPTDHGQLTTDKGQKAIVKILDFGLARLGGERGAAASGEMTSAGTAMGTADYMAPEQATDSHSVDIRADIYSVGCTLYKLLAGRAPFSGPKYKGHLEKITGHLRDTPPPIALVRTDVPPDLAAILERMMAKDRESRFATPQEVADALAPLAAGADLGRLAREAAGMAAGVQPLDQSSVGTDRHLTSAHTGTTPSLLECGALSPLSKPPSDIQPSPAPMSATAGRSSNRRRILIALLAAAAAIPLLFGIWVIIRDKHGKEVGRFQVPDGGTAEQVDDQDRPVKPKTVSPEAPKPPPKPSEQPAGKQRPAGTKKPTRPVPDTNLRRIATIVATKGEATGLAGWTIALKPPPEGVMLEQRAPVWRLDNGDRVVLSPYVGHSGLVAWSKDRLRFAEISEDGRCNVWDAGTGRVLVIVKSQGPLARVDYSPVRNTLATAAPNGQVAIWDATSGDHKFDLDGRVEQTGALFFSPDGTVLAAAGASGVHCWEVAEHQMTEKYPLDVRGGWDSRRLMQWSADAQTLYVRDNGGRLVCVRRQSGQSRPVVEKVAGEGAFHDDPRLPGVRYAWHDAAEGITRVAELETGQISALTLTSDGKWLAVMPDGQFAGSDGIEDQVAFLVPTAQGERVLSLREFSEQYGWKHDPSTVRLAPWVAAAKQSSGQQKPMELEGPTIAPQPSSITAGEPLSPYALVSKPPSLNGAHSWTIETIMDRGLFGQTEYDPLGRWFFTSQQHDTSPFVKSALTIWDAKKRKPVRRIVPPGAGAFGAWSPDGKYLATSSARSVQLWDSTTWKQVRTMQVPHATSFQQLSWSPSNHVLAVTGRTSTTWLCDPYRRGIREAIETQGVDYGSDWSRDGSLLALANGTSAAGRFVVFDVDSRQPVAVLGGSGSPFRVKFAWAGGSRLVADLVPGLVVYDFAELPSRLLRAAQGCASVGCSPDGMTVLHGGGDANQFDVVDMESGSTIAVLRMQQHCRPAWPPDQRPIVGVQGLRDLAWFTKANPVPISVVPGIAEVDANTNAVCWSPDGSGPAPTGIRPAQGIWWSRDGSRCVEDDHGRLTVHQAFDRRSWSLVGHKNIVADAAFSPDGKSLVTASADLTFRVWDIEASKERLCMDMSKGTQAPPSARVFWAEESRSIMTVVVGRPSQLTHWNAETGAKLRETQLEDWRDQGYAFNHGGSKLLEAGPFWREGRGAFPGLRIIDTESGKILKDHEDSSGPPGVRACRWLPDDRTVVLHDTGNRLHLYDSETGKRLRTLEIDAAGAAFNRDVSRVAVPLGGGAVRVYDTATFGLLYTMLYLRDNQWAAISPDGHFRGSPAIEKLLCYVVQTDSGQETLTPAEFEQRFGWKNDPSKVPHLPGMEP